MPSLITSERELARVIAHLRPHGAVSVDTEFVRTRTFYPIPALYQLGDGDEIHLIDPTPIRSWQPFVELLEDPGVIKIMHSCSEDLEVFWHHLRARPRAVFDTQLANAFVSRQFSISYAALVADRLDVSLGKDVTRSDWLKRPLTDEQIDYARDDVRFLPALHRVIGADLAAQHRESWLAEEADRVLRFSPGDPETYYRGLRRAWRYERRQLAALAALCAWREREARRRDIPRGHVVRDDALLELAALAEPGSDDLRRRLSRGAFRRYGEDVASVLAQAAALDEEALPARLPKPLSQRQSELVKRLRTVAQEAARCLNLADELLARRREVEACVRHHAQTGELPPVYAGWRAEVLGERFLPLLGEQLLGEQR